MAIGIMLSVKSWTFDVLTFLALSPVFRKVDKLSEEESAYHNKISRVQQGIDGKVAWIMNDLYGKNSP